MNERWTPAFDRLFTPEHELAGDTACRRWAWLDLCHMAQSKPMVRYVGGHAVPLGRGELIASLRFLGERWGWGKDKVRRFLEVLERDMRKIETVTETPNGTVYRIATYDTWALSSESRRDTKPDSGETAARQRRDKDKKVIQEELPPLHAHAGAEDLAAWLGEPGPVQRFMAAHERNPDAVPSIVAQYTQPSMVGETRWKGVALDDRKFVLAQVLEAFAAERRKYEAQNFDLFIRTRVESRERAGSGDGGKRPPRGGKPRGPGVNDHWNRTGTDA